MMLYGFIEENRFAKSSFFFPICKTYSFFSISGFQISIFKFSDLNTFLQELSDGINVIMRAMHFT